MERYEGGVISELEVKQAESELASARRVMPNLKSQLFARENELNILLGRNPTQVQRSSFDNQEVLLPSIPAGLPAQLLERRPDIRQAEQQLVASTARIGIAEADFLPSLSISGVLGLKSPNVSTLFNSTALAWEAGARVLSPIYRGGSSKVI